MRKSKLYQKKIDSRLKTCIKYCIQNKRRQNKLIGVSPAFYLSRCSNKFSFSDLINSLYWLSVKDFQAMQVEVFHPEQLKEWDDSNCKKLKKAADETNMKISQFVAHFLLNTFVSPESLSSEEGLNEISRIASFLSGFELTELVTVPLGNFQGIFSDEVYRDFLTKLSKMKSILNEKGIRMAVEPVPGSLGADLKVLDEIPGLGLNLDTGHLLCSGLDPFSLDESILKRVYATHLCDNNAVINTSSLPGSFHSREQWAGLIQNLQKAGYKGSFDMEIICSEEELEFMYMKGQFFLNSFKYNIIYSK
jgi:sugar phosphate isomerase/epimerase